MDSLLTAAAQEFEAYGFRDAKCSNIARRAGVTEAQLYRYFRSKTELFREAVFRPLNDEFLRFNEHHLADPEESNLSSSSRESMGEIARDWTRITQDFLESNAGAIFSLIVDENYAQNDRLGISEIDNLQEYFDRAASLMAQRSKWGAKDPTIDPSVAVRLVFSTLLATEIFKSWLFPEDVASEEDIREAAVSFVMNGVDL